MHFPGCASKGLADTIKPGSATVVPKDEEELDRRIAETDSGKVRLLSWAEAEQHILGRTEMVDENAYSEPLVIPKRPWWLEAWVSFKWWFRRIFKRRI